MKIHYISATAINTPKGVRHWAFCRAELDYQADRERYRHSPKEVTCLRCLFDYARIYPDAYHRWAGMTRRIRAQDAAGITYDWHTGQFHDREG